MSQTSTQVPVRDSGSTAHSLQALAGLSAAVMWPIGLGGLLRGEWEAAFFLAIPAAFFVFGRWLQSHIPVELALLTPDGIEFPGAPDDRRTVPWSDIIEIRWPKQRGTEQPITLVVRTDDDTVEEKTHRFPYHDAKRDDRLTLIRTLRYAAPHAEQTNWPEFCQRIALPLAEGGRAARRFELPLGWPEGAPVGRSVSCQENKLVRNCNAESQASQSSDDETLPKTALHPLARWYFGPLLKHHPFAAGILSPLAIPYLFAILVSRRLWWSAAVLIAVSAVVNIRLVWGVWAQPFAKLSLGMAAACFVFGFFGTKPADESETNDAGTATTLVWLALLIIGMPLLTNALVLGWLPPAMRQILPYVFIAAMFGPLVFLTHRTQRRRTEKEKQTRDEALARWDALHNDQTPPA